jgi:hypothetical protein
MPTKRQVITNLEESARAVGQGLSPTARNFPRALFPRCSLALNPRGGAAGRGAALASKQRMTSDVEQHGSASQKAVSSLPYEAMSR